jgi:hypothetical protein
MRIHAAAVSRASEVELDERRQHGEQDQCVQAHERNVDREAFFAE